MNEDKWDGRYLELARLVAEWSKDRAKVGAVVVRDNRVVATGFNGFPTGVHDSDKRLKTKKIKLALVVHAEENALITAGKNADGATMYVHGKPVCARCAGSMLQAGIRRVVAERPGDTKDTWDVLGQLALEMFDEKSIKYRLTPPGPDQEDPELVPDENAPEPQIDKPALAHGRPKSDPPREKMRPAAEHRPARRRAARAGGR